MRVLRRIDEFIFFLFDLITGDSRLFELSLQGPSKTADEKRYEFRIPILSIVISCFISAPVVSLANYLKGILSPDIIERIANPNVIERIVDPGKFSVLVDAVTMIDVCGFLLSSTIYIVGYRIARRKMFSWAVQWGKDYLDTHENFLGMYVLKRNGRGYELSKRWRNIRHLISVAILINCVSIMLLYIGKADLKGTIFSTELYHIVPFIFMTFLIECSLVLYCKENPDSQTGGRRRDGTLDLARLLAEYQRYSDQNNLYADVSYKNHGVNLHEESLDIQDELRLSKDSHIRYLVKYLEDRKREGRFYPSQCLSAVIKLLQGKSIFFATPFYRDIDVCIFFPVYTALLRGEKALILLEDDDKLDELCLWVKEGVEKVQNLIDFWNVDILDDNVRGTDVGILPFQNICQLDKIQGLDPFLRQVSFAVVLEAADLLVGGQEAVTHLADKIGSHMSGCTWLLCDRNAENMLDLYSHLLNAEFVYASATPLNAANMVTVHWKLETEPLRPWPPAERYLSIGAGIVEVAGRNRAGELTWYGEKMMPVRDWQWIMGQYYQQYSLRTGQMPQQALLDNLIKCEISGISCKRKKENFLIVEDASFNLYETQRQYATRGEEKLMLHILSPNYMLRDFMEDRKDAMEADAKYIAQFVPNYINSMCNVYLRLIRRMLERPIPESEVEKLLQRGGQPMPGKSCMEKIREAAKVVSLDEDIEIAITYQEVFSEKSHLMQQETCYQLVGEKFKWEFFRYFQQANYIDEHGNRRHIGQLFLAGHLEQKYLPGQFVVLDGKYYEVQGFHTSEYEKALEVRRTSEHIFRRCYYRQLRTYAFKWQEEQRQGREIDFGFLRLRCRTANICAHNYGYMEMNSWNDIIHGKYVPYTGGTPREYRGKQVLEVCFSRQCQDSSDEEIGQAASMASCIWLAALLGECFCTFFPQYHHLLAVAVPREKYQSQMEQCSMPPKILYTLLADVKKGASDDCFYIIEDSREDMGLLSCMEHNFDRMVKIIHDYMEWSIQHGNRYIRFNGTES